MNRRATLLWLSAIIASLVIAAYVSVHYRIIVTGGPSTECHWLGLGKCVPA